MEKRDGITIAVWSGMIGSFVSMLAFFVAGVTTLG